MVGGDILEEYGELIRNPSSVESDRGEDHVKISDARSSGWNPLVAFQVVEIADQLRLGDFSALDQLGYRSLIAGDGKDVPPRKFRNIPQPQDLQGCAVCVEDGSITCKEDDAAWDSLENRPDLILGVPQSCFGVFPRRDITQADHYTGFPDMGDYRGKLDVIYVVRAVLDILHIREIGARQLDSLNIPPDGGI